MPVKILMVRFVNAKINLGLNIVGKREDGYHLLETAFLPVGKYAGSALNPVAFCDILEVGKRWKEMPVEATLERGGVRYFLTGRNPGCGAEENLVVRGAERILAALGKEFIERSGGVDIMFYKVLPDGAGMGGGSADATFVMKMLNDMARDLGMNGLGEEELERIALTIGADCPFFVRNEAAYAEGIGEKLSPLPWLEEKLRGKWLAVVKPDLHISTKEAFAGVTPRRPSSSLIENLKRPIAEWRGVIHNDFEDSLFPVHPELAELKEALYKEGAEYASLTGSGAALYGIFPEREMAEAAAMGSGALYQLVIKN